MEDKKDVIHVYQNAGQKFEIKAPKKLLSPAKVGQGYPATLKTELCLLEEKCVQCGSRYNLSFDIREAYSLGGRATSKNLKLLCYSCHFNYSS